MNVWLAPPAEVIAGTGVRAAVGAPGTATFTMNEPSAPAGTKFACVVSLIVPPATVTLYVPLSAGSQDPPGAATV